MCHELLELFFSCIVLFNLRKTLQGRFLWHFGKEEKKLRHSEGTRLLKVTQLRELTDKKRKILEE